MTTMNPRDEAAMTERAPRFELSAPVVCRPLEEWKPVSVELLGCQTRIVQGARWNHRVIECGEGEPLLLLHGWGGHAETYARNMRNLGRHFHVYAVDALFHGYSSSPVFTDNEKRHDDQVDAIVDLLDALGHDWAHIEGESMGAGNACEFGLRYPDRAGKIVMNTGLGRVRLEKTDFPLPEKRYEQLAGLGRQVIETPTFELMQRRMEWLMADPSSMTDEMVEIRLRLYQDEEINAAMRRWHKLDQESPGPDPFDYDPKWNENDLREFKPDALVFWTEHNPGEGPELGEYFASRIPGCPFYLMEGAGHWPQWERPEEHDQVLIEFIKGQAATAGEAS